MAYLTLIKDNINGEHICCAFSGKKCAENYELKKQWLTSQFDHGYVFHRLDERAKVFIEFGPAEQAWVYVTAPNYMMIGCFWVSGKFKGHGHGKALLTEVIEAAKNQGKSGLVTVVLILNFTSRNHLLKLPGIVTCHLKRSKSKLWNRPGCVHRPQPYSAFSWMAGLLRRT